MKLKNELLPNYCKPPVIRSTGIDAILLDPKDPILLQLLKETEEAQKKILACAKVDLELLSRTYVTL